jgi:hypothetical protein
MGGFVLSSSPLWGENPLRVFDMLEAVCIIPKPKEELQILGRMFDVKHVVHEVPESAWLREGSARLDTR